MIGWIEVTDLHGPTCIQVSNIDGFFTGPQGEVIIESKGVGGRWTAKESYEQVKELIQKSRQE